MSGDPQPAPAAFRDAAPRSLGRSLTNRVLLLSLIGVLGLAGTIWFSLLNTLSRVQESLDQTNLEAAGVFDRFFLDSESDLRATSDGLASSGDKGAALLALLMRNKAFLDATLFAPDGGIQAQRHSAGHPALASPAPPSWLHGQPRFGEVEISSVMHGPQTHYVEIAVTATDDISLPKGLLLARVDLTALWDSALEITVARSAHVYLVDRSGEMIVFGNRTPTESGSNLNRLVGRSPTEISAARMSLLTGLNHRLDLVSAQPLRTVPWFAIVEEPARAALAPFLLDAMALLCAIVIVGILLLATIRFTRVRIVTPLVELRDKVAGISKGSTLPSMPSGHDDELGQLAASFNLMSGRMQQAFVDLEAKIVALQSAQEALQQSESRIRSISKNFTAGMIYQVVIRPDGARTFTFLSDSVRQLYGVTPEQGMADASLVYGRVHEQDIDALTAAEERARSRGEIFRSEVRIRDATGAWRWSSLVSTPRAMADGSICWDGIEMIVTERKRAEEERDRFEAQLRQREKIDAIGQLAAGIAHDFNNQLMGVMGNADLMAHKFDDPRIISYVQNIKASAQHAAGLTAQLLAFGRKGKFKSVITDTHQVIAEVVGLLSRSIDKRIEIEARLEARPSNVLGDPTQLQNALLNLGLNARDSMPNGGALVFATRLAEIAEATPGEDLAPGRYVEISVSDTGVGMDEQTKRRLYEPFFTTKEMGKGTGLGLASVYGTVRSHAGAIRVASEVGKGSTFTVFLPATSSTELPPPPPPAAPVRLPGRHAQHEPDPHPGGR